MNHMFEWLPDILNARQIASALGISRAGVYNLLSRTDFPTLHIGRRKMVMKNDLILWLRNQTNPYSEKREEK
ncbi:MAG: helix-turn-helix domain-containing protein [Clostridia bacterium]|nr:helix-turn-helix domain-containing protein [Clostridia bacterium]